MQWRTISGVVAPFAVVAVVACAAMARSPAQHIYFVEPQDGATVAGPFVLR
jgi:hypothetical protein